MSTDEALSAEAHFCLGRLNWRQSRFDAALSSFETARALARRLGTTGTDVRLWHRDVEKE